MDKDKFRMPFALFFGLIIGSWGVFIFGKFQYEGQTLQNNIYSLFAAEPLSFSSISQGISTLIGSSFTVNVFEAFSSEEIAIHGFFGILLGDSIWPVICTWIFTGFVVGSMAKGIKRGFMASLFVFGVMILFWVVFGVFAGMDLTSIFINNTLQTVSELGFVLIILVIFGIIGGWVSGPYDIL